MARAKAKKKSKKQDRDDRIRELLIDIIGSQTSEECRADHHGYCQAHSLEPIETCWVKRAEEMIADLEASSLSCRGAT